MQKAAIQKMQAVKNMPAVSSLMRSCAAFLLAAAKIGPMRPLGLAFAAAGNEDVLWRFGGAFLGSLLISGSKGGILYAAAVMICFSFQIALRGTKYGKKRFFLPAVAAVSLICVNAARLFSAFSVKALLLLFLEGAACFATSCAFTIQKDDPFALLCSRSLLIVGCLFAFEPLLLFGFISPAQLAAAICVLLISSRYGSAYGAGAGIIAGGMFDLSAGTSPQLAFVYALGGLLSGRGRSSPKVLRVAMWAVGALSAGIWFGGKGGVNSALSCIVSGAIFYILPFSSPQTKQAAGSASAAISADPSLPLAVERLGKEVSAAQPAPGRDRLRKALDRASDGVCSQCRNVQECWRKNFDTTYSCFMHMADIAKGKPELDEHDLPKSLQCVKTSALCREINRQLRACRVLDGETRRRSENAALMKRQYDGMSMLLRDLGKQSGRTSFLEMANEKTDKIMKTYYPSAIWNIYCKDGNVITDIFIPSSCDLSDLPAAVQSLTLALGLPPPHSIETDSGTKLSFCKSANIAPQVFSMQKSRSGELYNGDTLMHFITNDGRQVVLISDGMGTGKQASLQSASAVDMIAQLVKAGASLTAAAMAAAPVIEARFDREGFVTLDMIEIDLFSGEGVFVKYGASPSFVLRDGMAKQIWAQSLPAGLESEPALLKVMLRPNDTVVMLTDGIEVPDSFPPVSEQICAELLDGDCSDDKTAVAVMLTEV